MPKREQRTFFLYSQGFLPEQLRLGHLVFGSYANPLLEPQRTCAVDSSGEIDGDEWVDSLPLGQCCFPTTKYFDSGLGIPAMELIQLAFSFGESRARLVAARRGRRVTLKDPVRVFHEKVMGSDLAKSKLQRWTSLANSDYISNVVGFRKPKIWFMTGFYELEDAICVREERSRGEVELGISQELMMAFTSASIGASFKASTGKTVGGLVEMPGKNIWAAQFQLLDARYMHVDSGEPLPPLSVQVMYRPIYSVGILLDSDKKPDNVAQFTLHGAEDMTEASDKNEDAYWREMSEAEIRWDGYDEDSD